MNNKFSCCCQGDGIKHDITNLKTQQTQNTLRLKDFVIH